MLNGTDIIAEGSIKAENPGPEAVPPIVGSATDSERQAVELISRAAVSKPVEEPFKATSRRYATVRVDATIKAGDAVTAPPAPSPTAADVESLPQAGSVPKEAADGNVAGLWPFDTLHTINADTFYRDIRRTGIQYGPCFRMVERVSTDGSKAMLRCVMVGTYHLLPSRNKFVLNLGCKVAGFHVGSLAGLLNAIE